MNCVKYRYRVILRPHDVEGTLWTATAQETQLAGNEGWTIMTNIRDRDSGHMLSSTHTASRKQTAYDTVLKLIEYVNAERESARKIEEMTEIIEVDPWALADRVVRA